MSIELFRNVCGNSIEMPEHFVFKINTAVLSADRDIEENESTEWEQCRAREGRAPNSRGLAGCYVYRLQ
jgi:hypothetical protein